MMKLYPKPSDRPSPRCWPSAPCWPRSRPWWPRRPAPKAPRSRSPSCPSSRRPASASPTPSSRTSSPSAGGCARSATPYHGVPLPRHPRAVLPAPDHADPAGRQRGDAEHPGRRPDAVHPHQRLRLPRHQPAVIGRLGPGLPELRHPGHLLRRGERPRTPGTASRSTSTRRSITRCATRRPSRTAPPAHPDAGDQPELWGVPTSQPAYDPTNSGFVYQRFQRGIMHYDSATNLTQGLLLADYLKAILTGENLPGPRAGRPLQAASTVSIPPPPPWASTAPQLPGTDLTGAFVQDTADGTPVIPGRLQAPPSTPTASATAWACTSTTRIRAHHPDDQGGRLRLGEAADPLADVEKTKGQIDWTEIDKMVDYSLKAPLNISASSPPPPGRAPTGAPKARLTTWPTSPPLWPSSPPATGARCGPTRSGTSRTSAASGAGADQRRELRGAAQGGLRGVKASDPNALVVSGALTPTGFTDPNVAIDDVLYLEQMYQYKDGMFRQYADIIGAHAGGYNNPPDADPNTAHGAVPRAPFLLLPARGAAPGGAGALQRRREEDVADRVRWSTANQAPGTSTGASTRSRTRPPTSCAPTTSPAPPTPDGRDVRLEPQLRDSS